MSPVQAYHCPVCGAEPMTECDIGYETHCPKRCEGLTGESYDRNCSVQWWNESVTAFQELTP